MTSTDPRTDPGVVDLTVFDHSEDPQRRSDHGDLHLLRLALDLQLDAMLLTLGAAAHAESRGEPEGCAPWKRWLVEDLEFARTLATALVDNDGAPVPGLGGGLAPESLETSLENLIARFENIENLLIGVLDRPVPGQLWRGMAEEALQRCRVRLAELRRQCREPIAAVATLQPLSLPGEWLG